MPPGKSCCARRPTSVPASKRACLAGSSGNSNSGGFLASHSARWHCIPLSIRDLLRPLRPDELTLTPQTFHERKNHHPCPFNPYKSPADRFDHCSRLEPTEPPRRGRRVAEQRPEEIPGNRPGAVTVAAVVHRQTDTVREIAAGDQHGVTKARKPASSSFRPQAMKVTSGSPLPAAAAIRVAISCRAASLSLGCSRHVVVKIPRHRLVAGVREAQHGNNRPLAQRERMVNGNSPRQVPWMDRR